MKPFKIDVSEAVLADLRARLAQTRWPDEVNDGDWSYGTSLAYLKELCTYWRDNFDWCRQEAMLNRFPQFTTDIEGLRIHLIHVPSREKDALPLLITHGWPGSVVEFTKIIGPLSDPVAYGAEPRDAFHVICPSLPGYGFSQAPSEQGMSPERVAALWVQLMARLGYDRYGAQGGDWGSLVSKCTGALDPAHCAGVHLNLATAPKPVDENDPSGDLSSEDRRAFERRREYGGEETGYAQIQSTKPQTIGYALNDSPAGLAAWIVEKFRAWSDCGRQIETKFAKDELLTNITLYWVTGTITSSMRLYRESRIAGGFSLPSLTLTVPVGVARFPREIPTVPRRWVEKAYNVIHWTDMPRGGHFAAMEEPDLLVADIRAFFRKLR